MARAANWRLERHLSHGLQLLKSTHWKSTPSTDWNSSAFQARLFRKGGGMGGRLWSHTTRMLNGNFKLNSFRKETNLGVVRGICDPYKITKNSNTTPWKNRTPFCLACWMGGDKKMAVQGASHAHIFHDHFPLLLLYAQQKHPPPPPTKKRERYIIIWKFRSLKFSNSLQQNFDPSHRGPIQTVSRVLQTHCLYTPHPPVPYKLLF